MSTSLNGWSASHARLHTFDIPGTKRRATLNMDAGRILVALAADYHRTIRPIDKGTVDEGGYAYREARGADALSNHASGTAIDLNWREEGAQGSNWGRKFFAATRVRLGVVALKRRYGSVVQWGGDWRTRDYMHWEIKPGVTRADVLNAARRLGIDREGRRG